LHLRVPDLGDTLPTNSPPWGYPSEGAAVKHQQLKHELKRRGTELAEAAKKNIELAQGHTKLEAKMSAIEEAHEKETKLA
jgi:hypothetical protein